MRRALQGACLLFEDFGCADVVVDVAASHTGAEWTRSLGPVCVSRYEVGRLGRAEREAFVSTAKWRRLSERVPAQPAVHWLAERDCCWPVVLEPSMLAVVYTVDVERLLSRAAEGARRGVPGREELPDGLCWPVIGHPGRLLALVSEPGLEAVVAGFEQMWGPAAEPPVLHRFS